MQPFDFAPLEDLIQEAVQGNEHFEICLYPVEDALGNRFEPRSYASKRPNGDEMLFSDASSIRETAEALQGLDNETIIAQIIDDVNLNNF